VRAQLSPAALLLLAAAPAGACTIGFIEPVLVEGRGVVEGGVVRGPGCETALTLSVLLKEQVPGVDRVLARGKRTFRDGRMDLTYACRGPRDMKVYVELLDGSRRQKTPPVLIAGCG